MWQILGLMSMVLLTKAGPYTNNEQKQNKMFSLFNKNKIEEQGRIQRANALRHKVIKSFRKNTQKEYKNLIFLLVED